MQGWSRLCNRTGQDPCGLSALCDAHATTLYIAPDAGQRRVMWFNMREEPVIYINGNPYVVREANKPFANLEYTGVVCELQPLAPATLPSLVSCLISFEGSCMTDELPSISNSLVAYICSLHCLALLPQTGQTSAWPCYLAVGIDRSRVEDMENRLKQDVLQEAAQYNNQILVAHENDDFQVVEQWEAVTEVDVQTPLEVYRELSGEPAASCQTCNASVINIYYCCIALYVLTCAVYWLASFEVASRGRCSRCARGAR